MDNKSCQSRSLGHSVDKEHVLIAFCARWTVKCPKKWRTISRRQTKSVQWKRCWKLGERNYAQSATNEWMLFTMLHTLHWDLLKCSMRRSAMPMRFDRRCAKMEPVRLARGAGRRRLRELLNSDIVDDHYRRLRITLYCVCVEYKRRNNAA